MSRVLVWVQHLLGTGHLSRALTLGKALAASGLEVTVASGGPAAPWLDPGPCRLVQLPPIAASGPDFAALVDEDGREAGEGLWRDRQARLTALFGETRPAVVVTEMFPFGRRAFRPEVVPLLELAATTGAVAVASVRDVLVAKGDRERYRWMLDLARTRYRTILVHGDPAVIPFAATFPFTDRLGGRLVETGYIGPEPGPVTGDEGSGEVLVSAGGGRVGRELIEVAAAARALLPPGPPPWRLIGAGDALAVPASADLIPDRQRPDFVRLLANSLLSVSQAGYNTVVEAMTYKKRMVLVPFETAGETEQWTRATRLEELGLARTVRESALGPETLAAAVRAALADPVSRHAVDVSGAARSAAIIGDLVARAERGR